MTNESHDDAGSRAAEEAALWLEKLERTLKAGESESLRKWLKVRLHRKTIVERCRLWHGPEILAVLGELIPIESVPQRVQRWHGRMVLGIFLTVSAFSFPLLYVAASSYLPGSDAQGSPLRADAIFETPADVRRKIDLPDGSTMLLNTATRVHLNYSPRGRSVTLLRGEASFEVMADPDRPLQLYAGARRFEAVSLIARFNVRRLSNDAVELTVIEGQVRALESRFSAALTPAQLRARVSLGEHTFDASEGGIVGAGWYSAWKLEPHDVHERLAWQQGVTSPPR